ncbi:tRNA 2-thiocytidine biosynthesis protein TtcA [Trichoplax sp. H2]|nr:tRNA 2-thiocytidine biosynthesis protein TtcA [Trichoplax sp. H2]|eukprot:RDD47477.1 tRNA 2-thiocytidine biosynthesis protein TtcA [Trichoplax sp. H2]
MNYQPLPHGRRSFYEKPIKPTKIGDTANTNRHHPIQNASVLFQYINSNIIGKNTTVDGPYGKKSVIYCDYTASGKALAFIEDYIRNEVLPMYGNTHTTTTVTSQQTTLYRHEARDIIRSAVNASVNDRVIFTGSGCTGAIHELVHALNIDPSKTVIFVGPFEHHSNLLPWRELGTKVIRIAEDERGCVDQKDLIEKLQENKATAFQMIGCFSAASNITGILVDTDAITMCLHKHGALAFWDYATAAPYTNIDMNPVLTHDDQHLAFKDAIYLSPHKFVGGVGSPGLLIAKKSLFRNPSPAISGGGTVFFVTQQSHRYLEDIEIREEGGTPDIVGSVRASLAFQLKMALTPESIMNREREILKLALAKWSKCPNLLILGNTDVPRLPIFSFLIRHSETKRFLHYNYVCVLLNDLFGIQARGGCACAGPYAEDLLGINEELAKNYESILLEYRFDERSDNEILRPGFTRINLPYFMSDEEIKYITEALLLTAQHGWKLLPFYTFNPETSQWRHQSFQVFKDRKWLGNINYDLGFMNYVNNTSTNCKESLDEYLSLAKTQLEKIHPGQLPSISDQTLILGGHGESLRWFMYPCEAQQILLGKDLNMERTFIPPFIPRHYGEDGVVVLQDHACVINKCSSKISGNKTNGYENQSLSDSTPCTLDKNISNECDAKSGIGFQASEPKSKILVSQCKQYNFKVRFHVPPKKIIKLTIEAVQDFNMIAQNDKILVCISGGKDSLSLLHTLKQYQFYARAKGIHFDIGATTIDPQSSGYNPRPLIKYMAELGVPYFYEEQDIITAASNVDRCDSICSFCSRLKRGRIYACARREGYNVIALGQHLDDLSESFLMSIFHNGFLRTMKACYTVREKDLRVIRPFVYVREQELKTFAEQAKLPVIPENCPACFEAPKERRRVKQLLANQEVLFPMLHQSLLSSMKPLMSRNSVGMESRRIVDNQLDED